MVHETFWATVLAVAAVPDARLDTTASKETTTDDARNGFTRYLCSRLDLQQVRYRSGGRAARTIRTAEALSRAQSNARTTTRVVVRAYRDGERQLEGKLPTGGTPCRIFCSSSFCCSSSPAFRTGAITTSATARRVSAESY